MYDIRLCILCMMCVFCVFCVCMLACTCDVVNIVPVGASVPLAGRKVQPSRQLGSLTVGSALHCYMLIVNPFISTIIWHILVLSLFPPSFCWHM